MATATALFTLNELAARTGGSIASAKYWVNAVGGEIVRDWVGREAVDPRTVAKAEEAYRRAAEESASLQAAYSDYLRDWERQHFQVGEDAFQRVGARELERQMAARWGESSDHAFVGGYQHLSLGPAGREVAQQAADEARRKFEQKNPRLTFAEFEKKWRKGRR